MQSKLVSKPNETRVWIAVLEQGEEAKARCWRWPAGSIENASFVALGALKKR